MADAKEHLEDVRASFDAMDDYDAMVARAIPCYQAMTDALMRVARGLGSPKRILELGVGTGLLAQQLLRTFPKARLTAIDFAPNMITQAEKKLSRFRKRIDFIQGDFYDLAFPPGQDLIISALAIHHLDDVQKAQLYEKIRASLVDDGVFANADCVAASGDRFAELQEACWVADMRRDGVAGEQIDKTLGDHETHDIPATIDDQLGWLDRAGFAEAECLWRDFGFAIIVAIK